MDKATHGRPQGQRTRTGFTLIELLVVVSIIALLLGLLLPSLAGAREAANGLVCQSNLRSIGQAQSQYSADNRNLLAGSPASTGRSLLNDSRATDGMAEEVNGAATQPWDWAAPLGFEYMTDGAAMPINRSDRFLLLNGSRGRSDPLATGGPLGMLACPSNRVISAPYDGAVQPGGTERFPVQQAMSYQSARDILWGSGPVSGNRVPDWAGPGYWGNQAPGLMSQPAGFTSSFQLPGGSAYRPLMSNLAQPANKIFVYDGTRFQMASLRIVDHDVRTSGAYGGAFADLGGWDVVNTRALPNGRNQAGQNMAGLSFRHGVGGVDSSGEGGGLPRGNVGYYDGHVAPMDLDQARRPDPWLPSKTLLQPNVLATQALKDEYRARLSSGRIPLFEIP